MKCRICNIQIGSVGDACSEFPELSVTDICGNCVSLTHTLPPEEQPIVANVVRERVMKSGSFQTAQMIGIDLSKDNVRHPEHYTKHPSGIECIQVTEHMSFNLGNAIKYLFRNKTKHPSYPVLDLEKAAWYIDRL